MGKEHDASAWAKFWRLESRDRRMLIQAVLALAMARIQLARYSFEQLSERLGANTGAAVNAAEPEFLRRISYAISAAANHVPWRADCFPQCIAARSILSDCGIASTIHLGVERIGENDLAGHAWLTCGDTVVAGGGADLGRFTELHRYPG